MSFEERLTNCEKQLLLLSAAEKSADEWRNKVDRALFGYNGDSGMVDDVRAMKKVFRAILWVIGIAITPLLSLVGYAAVKVAAHIDQIIKLLDTLK